MARERDDAAAAKDLLSRLTKDDTLLEEVRKIALRGIISAQNGGRNVAQSEQDWDGRRMSSDSMNERITLRTSSSLTTTTTTRMRTDENDGAKELAFTVARDSETYRRILSTACWYRDALLIGATSANQRNIVQQNVSDSDECIQIFTSNSTKPNVASSAMAHPLLLSAAENYLRSVAAVDLLRPYVSWAASIDGPMLQVSTQSLAQSIPLAQTSCDEAMRENLLWVLKDEGWREFAKSITAKYVDRSYRRGE